MENNYPLTSKLNILACPNRFLSLVENNNLLVCSNCQIEFPIVLPGKSVFSGERMMSSDKTHYAEATDQLNNSNFKRRFRKSLPKASSEISCKDIMSELMSLYGDLTLA